MATIVGLLALALGLVSCTSDRVIEGSGLATAPSSSSTTPTPPRTSVTPSAPTTTAPPPVRVHIKLLNSDGTEYGVGMPEIAFFSRRIHDARPLQQATTVTVNGQPAHGAWYFERSKAGNGPVEGHFRLEHFWPAHARIHIDIPAKGLSAGRGMVYDDSLTSDWTTGPSHIATVSDATHRLTLVTDGRKAGTYPVSLGAPNTPTARGTKVIMEKGVSICMSGPGYHDCGVKYTQRLTYGGEYLHAAPWNCTDAPGCKGPQNNIGSGDSSNGCTNLTPDDAQTLYGILRIGDVVQYPDADGPAMTLGAGYGDWNVPWTAWQQGGLVPTGG